MRKIRMTCIGLLILTVSANLSYGQYMNKLHDIDSSNDWGWDIFIRADNSYFITGGNVKPAGSPRLFNMNISADGNTIIHTNRIKEDSAAIYQGDRSAGEVRRLRGGGYIAPFDIQYPNPVTGYLYSAAGIIKYDDDGDTVFIKTYTDTSIHFDLIISCELMADGGFLGGGASGLNTPSYPPGWVVRTDSMGDTLWTHTYQKYATQSVRVQSVVSLPDSRIVVGARSRYMAYSPSWQAYYHDSPWFLLLDSAGTVIRDTIYGSKYAGGGKLYRDTIGGYAHFGQIDTLAYPLVVDNYQNFSCYVAHLDTNFSMSWITHFPYTVEGRRHPMIIKQLHDGNYLALGGSERPPKVWAWAAKINRNDGATIWNHYYLSDSFNDAYFNDVAERDDGSLVFVGATFNDSLLSWRAGRDVWLLGTDSNGCPTPLCFEDTTTPPTTAVTEGMKQTFALYPNPTTGSFSLLVSGSGTFAISTIEGKRIDTRKVMTGINDISLPAHLANGLYLGVYTPDDGTKPDIVRFVYQR